LNIGVILFTYPPPSSDSFQPVQVHGPCSANDAAAMLQSALSSESFVGRALELEGNRNLLSSTPTSIDAALNSVADFAWRPLAARVAIMFPRNAPPGLDIHHIPEDRSIKVASVRWWQSCEKLRSMGVELHVIRLFTPHPYGPVSSCLFSQSGYPFSTSMKSKGIENMDASSVAAIDEVLQVQSPNPPPPSPPTPPFTPSAASIALASDASIRLLKHGTSCVAIQNSAAQSATPSAVLPLPRTRHIPPPQTLVSPFKLSKPAVCF
jgi:hypothetical protein